MPTMGQSKIFNVLNYGAVADDQTDNTAAFSACLQAMLAAGGGRMFLPAGLYRGRIIIPPFQASKPTHGTAGLITPKCNNAALTILRNVVVTGYQTGIVVNEYTDADHINLACNYNGLEFLFAHHASRFGRVGAQRCTHNITVTGKHAFCIEQLDMEIAGPRQSDANNEWQRTQFNIHDPDNLGTGDINYWVVEGDVGAVEKFVCNGGRHIQARRIGAPAPIGA